MEELLYNRDTAYEMLKCTCAMFRMFSSCVEEKRPIDKNTIKFVDKMLALSEVVLNELAKPADQYNHEPCDHLAQIILKFHRDFCKKYGKDPFETLPPIPHVNN